jgi:predicted amidohydrolase
MAGTVRLAATQAGYCSVPPEADPFGEVFRLEAAREHARKRIESYASQVEEAGSARADLAVTQEDVANLHRVVVYLDDPSIFRTLVEETSVHILRRFSDIARRHTMNVVVGLYQPEGDKIVNSAVLFGRDGSVIGRYRKVHLSPDESWLVTPGESFPAFVTDIGVVGMIVCYDDLWAESMLASALNGARIICHPMACASPPEWRMRTRAWDTQAFYVTSGYAGSGIVSPEGKMLSNAGDCDPTVVSAEADIEHASLNSENSWETIYSGIRDSRERRLKLRRPGAYRVLTDPAPPALRAYPPGGPPKTPEAIRAVYEKQKEEYRRRLRGEGGRYDW